MKIVIGKFSNEPFHALSKKDVNLLLKLVPNHWIKQLSSVVLSSKIFKKTKLVKPVEYCPVTKQLAIYSRGMGREDTAKFVLVELASIMENIGIDNTAELNICVKPYMDKFLKARV